jgi:hypothetical protein
MPSTNIFQKQKLKKKLFQFTKLKEFFIGRVAQPKMISPLRRKKMELYGNLNPHTGMKSTEDTNYIDNYMACFLLFKSL